jgi:hypothetical protein
MFRINLIGYFQRGEIVNEKGNSHLRFGLSSLPRRYTLFLSRNARFSARTARPAESKAAFGVRVVLDLEKTKESSFGPYLFRVAVE